MFFYYAVTKKSKGSAALTISSLTSEISDGIVFIFGGVTDAFGAAQEELLMVLKYIDIKATEISQTKPEYLLRKSSSVPGLIYNYGGTFRQACSRSCQMHNYERVLLPLLDNLLGKQGLAHEMTTSQGMYRVNYYWVKFRNMLDTLIIDSLGGDVNKYFEAPPSMRNLIGKVARTRWVSAERTSKKLMDALNVPASQALIDKVSTYFGGVDSEEWKEGSKFCTCVGVPGLSHLMLAFWWLANHTPGGKKGEGVVGCMSVVGFLGAPHHRVCLKLADALYEIHIKWAEFSDRSTEIGTAHAISTRAIENVIFERQFVMEIFLLCSDWERKLPGVTEYVELEAKRAVGLNLIGDEDELITYFKNIMNDGCKEIMDIVAKYFYLPGLRLGWSILQVVDPTVGPHAAGAILCVLRKLGLINLDPQIKDEKLLVTEDKNNNNSNDIDNNNLDDINYNTDIDDNSNTYNKIVDNINNVDDNDGIDNNNNVVKDLWTIDSTTHAFPNVTMKSYQESIMDSFLNAEAGVASGIVNAYGLSNPAIIDELLSIWEGKLIIELKKDNDEELDTGLKWSISDPLKKYWNIFEKVFPSLHDTLTVNFESRPITGTPAEQTFSMTATQVNPNNSASTNSKNMNHAQSVKGAILREMYNFKESHNTVGRKRLMRSNDSRNEYLLNLSSFSELLSPSNNKIQSVREMAGKGKKIAELVDIYGHTENEMKINEKEGKNKSGGTVVTHYVKRSTNAKSNNLDVVTEEVDALVEKAKKMSVKELKDALLHYYSDQPEECKIIQKLKKGDSTIPESLTTRIIDYWKSSNTLE